MRSSPLLAAVLVATLATAAVADPAANTKVVKYQKCSTVLGTSKVAPVATVTTHVERQATVTAWIVPTITTTVTPTQTHHKKIFMPVVVNERLPNSAAQAGARGGTVTVTSTVLETHTVTKRATSTKTVDAAATATHTVTTIVTEPMPKGFVPMAALTATVARPSARALVVEEEEERDLVVDDELVELEERESVAGGLSHHEDALGQARMSRRRHNPQMLAERAASDAAAKMVGGKKRYPKKVKCRDITVTRTFVSAQAKKHRKTATVTARAATTVETVTKRARVTSTVVPKNVAGVKTVTKHVVAGTVTKHASPLTETLMRTKTVDVEVPNPTYTAYAQCSQPNLVTKMNGGFVSQTIPSQNTTMAVYGAPTATACCNACAADPTCAFSGYNGDGRTCILFANTDAKTCPQWSKPAGAFLLTKEAYKDLTVSVGNCGVLANLGYATLQ